MRDDYLKNALKVIGDPNIVVNIVSLRVKQLNRGSRPLVESLEKLSSTDIALREIAEGKISYELAVPDVGGRVEHRYRRVEFPSSLPRANGEFQPQPL